MYSRLIIVSFLQIKNNEELNPQLLITTSKKVLFVVFIWNYFSSCVSAVSSSEEPASSGATFAIVETWASSVRLIK